jgi:hypothetical protein
MSEGTVDVGGAGLTCARGCGLQAAELLMTGNAVEYEEVMREAKLQGKVDRRLGGNLKPQQDKDLGVGAAAAQATPDEPEARQQAIEEQVLHCPRARGRGPHCTVPERRDGLYQSVEPLAPTARSYSSSTCRWK